MSYSELHTVPDGVGRIRLSDYVVGKFVQIPTRKGMKKAIAKGWVQHNGGRAHSGTYILSGDVIELRVQKEPIRAIRLKNALPVLFEDSFLAVVDKPAGLVTSGYKQRTLENALPSYLESSSQEDALDYPLAAHRLDKETSGLVIVAKTGTALRQLNKQFEARSIKKKYEAWVVGAVPVRMHIGLPLDGKNADSNFYLFKNTAGYSHLDIDLGTGRTHQIRRHLSMVGHPIVGDGKYGGEASGTLFLRAIGLQLIHPVTQEDIKVRAPRLKQIPCNAQ